MKLNPQTPKQSLNKAFLKQPVNRDEITLFKANLQTLLGKVNDKESEEHHKNFVRDFLKDTFYKLDYEINTKGRQDLVIHVGKDASDKVGVILEAKKPTNKGDMISADNPNRKALHELVLYFLRERVDENNFDIKFLVITNINEWFIFDASVFNQLFFENKAFVKDYKQWRDKQKTTVKTDLFYNEIAKPYIETIEKEIACTYFDIRKYETALNNADLKDDESLIELFKILSPQHLLKVPFADDSNKLDKNFYTELLHIVGLEEIKDKGKLKIDRKVKERRNAGSLLENAIAIIETKDNLHKVKNLESYGEKRDERLFGVALELCLTWINRVLFLKLLEAQLVDYHKGNREYRFLDIKTIQDFDELFTLFHQVLAKTTEDRRENIKAKYARVPYLNSSLFEISELEGDTITIESLKDTIELPFNSASILKDGKQNGLPTLEYLFKFLDAYDFASEGAEGIKENNRSLINASVLGKIFEKVNNAKAGSIYTPGFITMYMCRQAIRLAVVQKFKDAYGWNIVEFADIKNYLADRRSKADILEFNALVNSLHLCDPAVGSGHFLVSSLNEIIAIKCELGILADADGGRFSDVEITIENDELIVFDTAKSEFFKYQITDGKPNSREAQRLQKTLFHEKQTLIENCLFGVDIIPHSVKICRLRLWIELLKNAYYKESSGYAELETLPNIDINIKEGNSLVSRFALDEDLKEVLKNKKNIVEQYRTAVADYKKERNRDKKRELLKIIDEIKGDFQTEIYKHHPKMVELARRERRFFEINSPQLFDKYSDGERETLSGNLEKQISEIKQEIEAIKSNVIYRNAFEWRFEFPEVLDEKGNFTGFDIIIGNPPYIKEYENKQAFDGSRSRASYQGKMDIWYLFGDLGLKLLQSNAVMCFIATNNWVTNSGASKLRNIIINNAEILSIIDFGSYMIFENASIQTMIMLFRNNNTCDNYEFDYRRLQGEQLLSNDVFQILEKSENQNSILLSPIINKSLLTDKFLTFNSDKKSVLLNKIKLKQNFQLREKDNKKLGLKSELGQGIVAPQDFVNKASANTLKNKVEIGDGIFVLSQKEFKALNFTKVEKTFLKPYFTTEELQKYYGEPRNKYWLIYTKSNIDKQDKNTTKKPIDDLPTIKQHLDKFKSVITSDFKPYGLHRAREQHFFEGEKIMALRKCPVEPIFTYTDFSCFVSQTFFIIQTNKISLKFLTGLLNSKLIAFWLKHKGKMQGNNYQLDKEPLLEIPIYKPLEKDQQPFVALVDQILELKKAGKDTLTLENEIDRLVYRLYDLTDDEIRIVEGKEK